MKTIRNLAVLGFIIAAMSFLTACGTVHGFGKDVATTGHDIERAAH